MTLLDWKAPAFKATHLMIVLLLAVQMLMVVDMSVGIVVILTWILLLLVSDESRGRCCLGGQLGQFGHSFDDEYLQNCADDDVEDTGHSTHSNGSHLSRPNTDIKILNLRVDKLCLTNLR